MSINWATTDFGAKLLGYSSEVEGCEAQNVLDPNIPSIWLTEEGLPHWICISLADVNNGQETVIRTIGWHCWHPYTTNPSEVVIHVSNDGAKFKNWDTFTSSQVKGTQLFCCTPISTTIYPYIAFEITKTFGGQQTYLNRVYMYSEEIPSSPAVLVGTPAHHSGKMAKEGTPHQLNYSRDSIQTIDNDDDSLTDIPTRKISESPARSPRETQKTHLQSRAPTHDVDSPISPEPSTSKSSRRLYDAISTPYIPIEKSSNGDARTEEGAVDQSLDGHMAEVGNLSWDRQQPPDDGQKSVNGTTPSASGDDDEGDSITVKRAAPLRKAIETTVTIAVAEGEGGKMDDHQGLTEALGLDTSIVSLTSVSGADVGMKAGVEAAAEGEGIKDAGTRHGGRDVDELSEQSSSDSSYNESVLSHSQSSTFGIASAAGAKVVSANESVTSASIASKKSVTSASIASKRSTTSASRNVGDPSAAASLALAGSDDVGDKTTANSLILASAQAMGAKAASTTASVSSAPRVSVAVDRSSLATKAKSRATSGDAVAPLVIMSANDGDRSNISGDRHSISGDRNDLSGDRGNISGDRHNLSGDRSNISGDRHSISGDRHNLSGDRSNISAAASAATSRRGSVSSSITSVLSQSVTGASIKPATEVSTTHEHTPHPHHVTSSLDPITEGNETQDIRTPSRKGRPALTPLSVDHDEEHRRVLARAKSYSAVLDQSNLSTHGMHGGVVGSNAGAGGTWGGRVHSSASAASYNRNTRRSSDTMAAGITTPKRSTFSAASVEYGTASVTAATGIGTNTVATNESAAGLEVDVEVDPSVDVVAERLVSLEERFSLLLTSLESLSNSTKASAEYRKTRSPSPRKASTRAFSFYEGSPYRQGDAPETQTSVQAADTLSAEALGAAIGAAMGMSGGVGGAAAGGGSTSAVTGGGSAGTHSHSPEKEQKEKEAEVDDRVLKAVDSIVDMIRGTLEKVDERLRPATFTTATSASAAKAAGEEAGCVTTDFLTGASGGNADDVVAENHAQTIFGSNSASRTDGQTPFLTASRTDGQTPFLTGNRTDGNTPFTATAAFAHLLNLPGASGLSEDVTAIVHELHKKVLLKVAKEAELKLMKLKLYRATGESQYLEHAMPSSDLSAALDAVTSPAKASKSSTEPTVDINNNTTNRGRRSKHRDYLHGEKEYKPSRSHKIEPSSDSYDDARRRSTREGKDRLRSESRSRRTDADETSYHHGSKSRDRFVDEYYPYSRDSDHMRSAEEKRGRGDSRHDHSSRSRSDRDRYMSRDEESAHEKHRSRDTERHERIEERRETVPEPSSRRARTPTGRSSSSRTKSNHDGDDRKKVRDDDQSEEERRVLRRIRDEEERRERHRLRKELERTRAALSASGSASGYAAGGGGASRGFESHGRRAVGDVSLDLGSSGEGRADSPQYRQNRHRSSAGKPTSGRSGHR